MVAIPKNNDIATLIYEAYEKSQDTTPRRHLGSSEIGEECQRKLWYGFRWVQPKAFPGRILRLFKRGQNEESVIVADLRAIGVEVHEVDPETGKQFSLSSLGGHYGGSMDGVGIGVPEAPKTWHVLEFKTHSVKSFAKLKKEGVQKSHPKHFFQMQDYMHRGKLERALYVGVCKDTDEIYTERIRYDGGIGIRLLAKAEYIITSSKPPARMNDDPAWYECKLCDYNFLCHGLWSKIVLANCRTCLHSTPIITGAGAQWSCAAWEDTIPESNMVDGCQRHAYIPDLLAPWKVLDATDSGVIYETAEGVQIENGPGGHESATMVKAPRAFWENKVAPAIMEVFLDAEILPEEGE